MKITEFTFREVHLPGADGFVTRNHLQQRCFAGTIGADNANPVTAFEAKFSLPYCVAAVLVRDDHFVRERAAKIPALSSQMGKSLREIDLPGSCLVMLVERDEQLMIAEPDLTIEADDLVSILGEPNDLSLLYDPTYLD